MSLISLLKNALIDTPLEDFARRVYMRLDRSQSGRYDQEALAVMRRRLQIDSNCIDVGAYRGGLLRVMLQLAPQGTHFAFEPVPRQYRYLVETYPGVKVHQVALSDSPGEATFVHVVSRPTYSGLRAIQYPSPDERIEAITVRTARLDDLIPPDLPIHFVKVDVEGGEFQVFSGGMDTLRKNQPVVVFEHGQAAAAVYGAGQEALYDLLVQDCGLRMSLMSRWLNGETPLGRGQFVDEVQSGRNFYFIAYPED